MKNENKGMLLDMLAITAFGLTLPATKIALFQLDPIFIGLGCALVAGSAWLSKKIPITQDKTSKP
jgi:hypothetical protein